MFHIFAKVTTLSFSWVHTYFLYDVVIKVLCHGYDKDYLTPTYEYYDDDHKDATPDAPPEKLTPTPEIGDNYLNMELMLPRGAD